MTPLPPRPSVYGPSTPHSSSNVASLSGGA